MTDMKHLPSARSVLAVCAHPDDESFGLGAIISALTDRRTSVELVTLTCGEASTLGIDAIDLAATRRHELHAAAAVLGIDRVHQFDHPDGHLATIDIATLTAALRPLAASSDFLLVFDESGITGHTDHIHATATAMAVADDLDVAVLAWTLDRHVADALNTEFSVPFVGRPPEEIDIRLAVDRTRQHAAIKCHRSQLTGNPIPARRLALTGASEPLHLLRRSPNRRAPHT